MKSASSSQRERLCDTESIEPTSHNAEGFNRHGTGSFESVGQGYPKQFAVCRKEAASGPPLQEVTPQNTPTNGPERLPDERDHSGEHIGNSLVLEVKHSETVPLDTLQRVLAPAKVSRSSDTLITSSTTAEIHKPVVGLGIKTKRTFSPFESLPGCQIMPEKFAPLIFTLQELRKGGALWPSYSKVIHLVSEREDLDLFRRAGIENFTQYIELATKEGIVEVMGQGEKTWVGLRLKWYDAVPS